MNKEKLFSAILYHIGTLRTGTQAKGVVRWIQTYNDYYNDLTGLQILIQQLYLRWVRIDNLANEQQVKDLTLANNKLRNEIQLLQR